MNESELNMLVECRSRFFVVSWVPDHGTYISERYLDIGLMSELPLCLTRRATVTLKPLFQHILLKQTPSTTVVSLVLLVFSPCIKPYRTSRPSALLKIPPCISFIPLFLVIVIVRSTYSSRSQIVDSRAFRPPFEIN